MDLRGPASRIAAMLGLTRNATEFLLVLLAVWLTIGVTLAVLMGRRGHSPFEWFLIGAALGPFALPLAWVRIKDEAAARKREVIDVEPGRGTGPLDVLVGVDGSHESEVALQRAAEILGTRIGRLTLATVTEFDYGSPQAEADVKRARETLRSAAALADVPEPGIVLLSGRPADALSEYAQRNGYELVVVGRRGRGASNALLGSTAARITQSPVAILVI
jgi:nucleotide-binding universal stress UspA family protein